MIFKGILLIESSNEFEEHVNSKNSKNEIFSILKIVSDNMENSITEYVEKNELKKINKEQIAYEWTLDGDRYVILKEKLEEIIAEDKVPVILIDENTSKKIIAKQNGGENLLKIFLYKKHNVAEHKEKEFYQINKMFFDNCEYCLHNKSINDTYFLIKKLWEIKNIGGGLSRDIILKMIKCDLLISGGTEENVSNASYDLSLGDEYYYGGDIRKLNDKKPFVAIEPYDYVIASCDEKIIMPRDISARFDVSVNLFCQGIILSNSTQVDPGFRGKLFCLLFNTSNKVVYLKRKKHFATIEFNRLIEPSTSYSGKYCDENSIVHYLPENIMQGAINELKKEIENLKRENQKMQSLYLSALAIFLAIISVFLVFK